MNIWTKDFMAWAKAKPTPKQLVDAHAARKTMTRLGCLLTAVITIPILILLLLAL